MTPKVFVSYSHDSDDHRAWVLRFAEDLRRNGVDAVLDRWDLKPGQDIALFMQQGITNADRVLLVCSEEYVRKAESGVGGVGFERLIVTSEVVSSIDTKKFIPIIRRNTDPVKVPRFLGPRLYIDFNNDGRYAGKLEELLRELLGIPAVEKPPLGASPFSGVPGPSTPARAVSPSGATATGERILDNDWFRREADIGRSGLSKGGIQAYMEIRFGLHETISKSQIELLTSVKTSEIKTFGWPIGVTLENREEYRPRPYNDGIRAEISLSGDTSSGRTSYDYWTMRSNGDFYLIQSLFEDTRSPNSIFFNTRIVRITEALMFASSLYHRLGVSDETLLNIRIRHAGFRGRVLSTSSTRFISGNHFASDDQTEVEIASKLGELRGRLVENVKTIAAPMFMLFDFQEFADEIYADIVQRFALGEVS